MLRGSILSIVASYIVWIRITRQIFSQSDKRNLILTSIRSIIYTVLAFFLYNINYFFSLSQDKVTSIIVIGIIILFCIPLLPIQRKSRITSSLFRIGLKFGIGGIIGNYSLSAWGEEMLKRKSIQGKQSGLIQSMILGAIVSALVFGLVENIIYMIATYQSHQLRSQTLIIGGQRAFIPIITHIGSLSLGLISIILLKNKISSSQLLWTLGISIIIFSHFLYNITQSYEFIGRIRPLLIMIYLCSIYYALFRSDTLYLQQPSNT